MALIHNDILRQLRYAFNFSDATMLEILKLGGFTIELPHLANMLRKENDRNFVACSDSQLDAFLDGLIIYNRGPRENAGDSPVVISALTNNVILRKLRIALEFKENDMLDILQLAGISVSKSELGALFRKAGHRNYKECGDQFLRNFIRGLTLHFRK